MDFKHAQDICKGYSYHPQDNSSDDNVMLLYDFKEWFAQNLIFSNDIVDFEREENLLHIDMSQYNFQSPLLLPSTLVDDFLNSRK